MGYIWKYKNPFVEKEEKPKNKYEMEYPWFDNFYLTARLNIKTKKPELIISIKNEKQNVMDSHTISCIHVVINETNLETFVKNKDDPDWHKHLIETSGEKKIEINLKPNTRFFALNSWVQGISENGINSLFINSESEMPLEKNWSIPIISQLMNFVIKYANNFVFQFLEEIVKKSKYENIYSESYLISNLRIILDKLYDLENYEKIIDYLIMKELPVNVYLEFYGIFRNKILNSDIIQDFIQKIDLQKYNIPESKRRYSILIHLKELLEQTSDKDYIKYDYLFDLLRKFILIDDQLEQYYRIDLWKLREIDFSKHFDIFELIIKRDLQDINDILSNSSIIKLPDKSLLFKIQKEEFLEKLLENKLLGPIIYTDYLSTIKELINSEYRLVRLAIVKRFDLADKIPIAYDQFFDDISGTIRSYYLSNPKTHNRQFVKEYLRNPVKRKQLLYFIFTENSLYEYKDVLSIYEKGIFQKDDIKFLFSIKKHIEYKLARCELATFHKEFESIISNDTLKYVLMNPGIINVPEFVSKYITFEKYILYGEYISKNSSINNDETIKDFQYFLSGKENKEEYFIPDENFKAKKVMKKVTDKIGYNSLLIRVKLASNSIFVNSYGYKILFKEKAKAVLEQVAKNKLAPINHSKEYAKFFESNLLETILFNVIENQNAYKVFPGMFEYLITRFKEDNPKYHIKILTYLSNQEYLANTLIFDILRNMDVQEIKPNLERSKNNWEKKQNAKNLEENDNEDIIWD